MNPGCLSTMTPTRPQTPYHLIIWALDSVEVVGLGLALDAGEALLVVEALLGVHLLSFEDLLG